MKISAVLIGKNEEEMLPRVMKSLQGIDEIVYCDTGSKDKSVIVAREHTDNVQFREWDDSFANARNYAKNFAHGDWILSIDCDEYLHDLSELRKAVEEAEKRGALAIDCKMIAEGDTQFFMFPRLFKNDPRVWWEGDVHNHLSVLGEIVGDVKITHGYSPAHALDPDRSLRILEKSVKERGGPREMFYLGREYYYRGRHEDAVVTLGKYVQLSRYLAEKADAFLIMSKCYWAMKMADDARDAIVQSLIINATFKEAILWMATLSGDGSGNDRWQANADQWKKMAETAVNKDVLFVRD